MKFPRKKKNQKTIDKGWGTEIIIHDNERYCVKKLDIQKGGQCSLHFHKKKEESFLVLEGELQMTMVKNSVTNQINLTAGQSIDIPIEMPHQFKALTRCIVIEASNEDFEEDLIRIEDGDTQKNFQKQLPISNRDFIEWEKKCKARCGN